MEQFRAFLEVLKKYHFWVLCGLILLLSFGSWFWAASSEDKLFGTRKGQLESKLGVLKQISGNLEHPSEEYINKILNVTGGSLADQVAALPAAFMTNSTTPIRCPNFIPIMKPSKRISRRRSKQSGVPWRR